MWRILMQDLFAVTKKSSLKSFLFTFSSFPGFRAVVLYRISNLLHQKGFMKMSKIIFNLNHFFHSCEINPGAKIGLGLYLPHVSGIVIGEGAKIGIYCTLYQHVTIGRSHTDASDYPEIGDHVAIYVGASILGRLSIGNFSKIGAHSLVLSDVPDGHLAVGMPSRNIDRRIQYIPKQ